VISGDFSLFGLVSYLTHIQFLMFWTFIFCCTCSG